MNGPAPASDDDSTGGTDAVPTRAWGRRKATPQPDPSAETSRRWPLSNVIDDGLWSTTGLVLAGNAVARALGFLFPLILTHATERADFASVYFFINTGYVAGELVLLGYPTALTRFLASEPEAALKASWLVSALVGGAPLLVFSLVAGETLARAGDSPPLLMSVVVIGLSIDAYYFGLLRGLQQFATLVTYRVSANSAQLVLLLIAVELGIAGVTTAVTIYSLVYLIPIAAIEATRGPLRRILGDAEHPLQLRVRSVTRFAVPSLVSGSAYAVVLGLDVFFVRVFAPGDLADYGAARALTIPLLLLPFATGIVLMPRVAAGGEAERWSLLLRSLGTTAAITALVIVAYVVLGQAAVDLVFLAAYSSAGELVGLLAPALGLIGVYSVLSQWWLGNARPIPPAISLTVGALVAVAGHLSLTATEGATGASISIGAGAGAALLILGCVTARAALRERRRPPAWA